MRGPGLRSLVQIVAGISIAGPMFVVGVEFLRDGRVVAGLGFLTLGAGTLYFPTYLVARIGGPRTWLRRRFGSDESASDSGSGGLLERLRR